KLDYLDRQAVDNARRREVLESEHQAFDVDALDEAAARLSDDHDQHQQKVESLGALLDEHKVRHENLQDEERQVQSTLDDARQQLQTTRGRLASLEALQNAALGQDDDTAGAWLDQHDLTQAARLGASLDVDAGWEAAVESVLAGMLDGVLVTRG